MPANPNSSALGFPERGIGFTEPPRPQKPINYVEIPIDRGLPVPGAGTSARVPQTRPPARVPAPAGNPYGGGGAFMGIAGPLGWVADTTAGQYNETYQRYERWKQYGISTQDFFKLPKDVREKILSGEAPLIRPDLNDQQWQEYLDKLGEIKRGRDKAYRQWVEEQERKRKEFQKWRQQQESAKGRPPYKDDPYNDDSKKSPFQGNSPYNPQNVPPGDSRNPSDPGSWWNPDNPDSPFNRDNPNNPWDKNDPMNPGNPNSPLNPKNPNSPYNPNNPDSPYYNPPPFENGTPGGLPGSSDPNVLGTWTLVVRATYQYGPDSPPYTYSIPGTAADTFGARTVGDCIQLVRNGSSVIEPCYTKLSNRGTGLIIGATFTPPAPTQPNPAPQTSPPPFPPPAKNPEGNPDPKAPPIPAPANPPAGLPTPPPTPAGKPALDPGQTPTPAPKPAPAPELPRLPNWQPSPLPPLAPPQRQPGTAPGTGAGSGVGASGSPQQQWNQTPSEIIEREPLRTPSLGLLPGIDPNTGALIRPGTQTRMPPNNFLRPFDTPFEAPLPTPTPTPTPNPNPNPNPNPSGDICNSPCIQAIGGKANENNQLLQRIAAAIGVDDLPVTAQLLSDDPNSPTVTYTSLVQLLLWSVRNLDAVTGLFPIEIPIIDGNNNEQTIKIENVSHAFFELFALLRIIAEDADAAVNCGARATIEAIQSKIAAMQSGEYAKANAKFLGYIGQAQQREVKITVTPAAQGLDNKLQNQEMADFLEPSTQTFIGWECQEKVQALPILQRILEDGEIARAALFTPLKEGKKPEQSTVTGTSIKYDKKTAKAYEKAWDAFKDTLRKEGLEVDDKKGKSNGT